MTASFRNHRAFTFKSEEKPWVSNGQGSIPFTEFVETKGPNNMRTVIDGFMVFAKFTLTIAAAPLLGSDLWNLIRGITIEDKAGNKRYDDVPGDALRIADYGLLGPDRVKEFTDVAIGANVPVMFSCYVPLTKPYAYNPLDFAMAADVFKELRIRQAVVADFPAGPAITIVSGTYWVVAHCHEEEDGILHALDTIYIHDFESTNEAALSLSGRLQDCYLYAPGAGGGQLFSDVNDVRIVELMREARYTLPDLANEYEFMRGQATNLNSTTGAALRSDPFVVNNGLHGVGDVRAIALWFSDGTKIPEVQEAARLHIKTTSGTPPGGGGTAHTGNLRAILRVCEPRSEKLDRAVANKYKAKGKAPKLAKVNNNPPSEKSLPYLPQQLRKA